MKTSAACLPGSTLFGRRELLKPTCRLYGLAVEDAEFTVFIRKMQIEKHRYPTLVEVLDSCPMDIYSNINALLRDMVTLPMIACTVERLFSTAHRIKTRLMSSMSTLRHNNLSLLSMERELADSLDNEEIIALFNSKPRRLRLVYSFYAGLPNSRTDTRVVMPAVVNQMFI